MKKFIGRWIDCEEFVASGQDHVEESRIICWEIPCRKFETGQTMVDADTEAFQEYPETMSAGIDDQSHHDFAAVSTGNQNGPIECTRRQLIDSVGVSTDIDHRVVIGWGKTVRVIERNRYRSIPTESKPRRVPIEPADGWVRSSLKNDTHDGRIE